MALPEYIILFSFVISIAVVVFLNFYTLQRERHFKFLIILFSTVWAGVTFFGEFIYFWAGNATCSKYLGCVAGFFGYDAFEHFFFGILCVLIIIWFCEHFPKYSVLTKTNWKDVIIIISLVAFVAVFWEIVECAHDALRVDVLHESLRNFSLHLNLLDQPTNLDTMGDIVFSLLGSIVAICITKKHT